MINMRILNPLIVYLLLITSYLADAGELATPNNLGGDFRFASTLGEPIAIKQLRDKIVLLNFGFTSCPDVCPMVLSELARLQQALDNEATKLQVVFVTVDPKRDSLQKLQQYLAHFHSSFIGMRDDNLDAITAVMKRYGGALVSDQSGEEVTISHSDYVYMINRDGHVSGFYDIASKYDELVAAVNKAL